MEDFLKKFVKEEVVEYAILVIGCFLIALSFNLFLLPNKIASGGLPGLSVVLNKILGMRPAYIQWGINTPLFLFGVLKHGRSFGLKTIIGSFSIPLFVLLTSGFSALTHNVLIGAVIGGIGTGLGLGLVFKAKGTVGGFSLAARLLHDYSNLKISTLILLLNGSVVFLAGLVFGFYGALYAFLSLVITTYSMEFV